MSKTNLAEMCDLFLALSDSTRLKLIRLMANGEVSVGYLADSLGESQPKVSRHLAYLRTAGLVATRRDGKHIYYGIDWPADADATSVIEAVVGERSQDQKGEPRDSSIQPSTPDLDPHYTSESTYMNEYAPQEIEIYLL